MSRDVNGCLVITVGCAVLVGSVLLLAGLAFTVALGYRLP
jgi:hypothetical protein